MNIREMYSSFKGKKQEMYEVGWSHDQTLKDFTEDLIMHQQSSHKI